MIITITCFAGTGGSCVMAIQELIKKGADVKNMLFLNVVCSPEGVAFVHSKYPDLLILSGEVDAGLNEKVRMLLKNDDYYV